MKHELAALISSFALVQASAQAQEVPMPLAAPVWTVGDIDDLSKAQTFDEFIEDINLQIQEIELGHELWKGSVQYGSYVASIGHLAYIFLENGTVETVCDALKRSEINHSLYDDVDIRACPIVS